MKKLAVWKFSSCDGCQLSLLDCEDELLPLAREICIANFPEASSAIYDGPYDLSLVEGSISTPEEKKRIQEVRAASKYLISIGACATAGGIQALRNFHAVEEWAAHVYPNPQFLKVLETCTPIRDHVKVDFEIRGCPISKEDLLEAILAFLQGRKPQIPEESVCVACKKRNNVCVLVMHGEACLGPVTQAGCQALCPRYGRGCFGCYGPKENSNYQALISCLKAKNIPDNVILRLLRTFNVAAEPNCLAAEQIEAHNPFPDASERAAGSCSEGAGK